MIIPPDEHTAQRTATLAAGDSFAIEIRVERVGDTARYRAEARWGDGVLAVTETHDAVAAYRGAADAAAQVLARNELSARLTHLAEFARQRDAAESSPATSESFDWEDIDTYERPTGIDAIDKALAYNDPAEYLRQHLARRERDAGRDAVVGDLTALIEATPPTSVAHEGAAAWLKRYREGVSAADL